MSWTSLYTFYFCPDFLLFPVDRFSVSLVAHGIVEPPRNVAQDSVDGESLRCNE